MLALLEPIGATVLVRPIAAPKMTAGGIVLPDATQETYGRGIIEKVGPGELDGTSRRPMPVEVGDLVFFGRHAGTWVNLFGVERLALQEAELSFRIPAELVETIAHPDDHTEHLAGEPCEFCAGPPAPVEKAADPEDQAAAARLRDIRLTILKGGTE